MLIVLDTTALVRFFTNDSPEKAEKIEKLIEEEKNILVPDVVFPELEYVLTKEYSLSRNKIVDVYQFLLAQSSITTSPHIKKAVEIFAKTKLDMADCIIASHAQKGELASFDRELLDIEGIKPFWQ